MNRLGPLSPETIAEIASALADALEARRSRLDTWVDAGTVAAHLGVDRAWIYQHSRELGAVRLGNGDRGRLRFHLRRVDELLAARTPSTPGTVSNRAEGGAPQPIPRRRRHVARVATAETVPLLPVHGRPVAAG